MTSRALGGGGGGSDNGNLALVSPPPALGISCARSCRTPLTSKPLLAAPLEHPPPVLFWHLHPLCCHLSPSPRPPLPPSEQSGASPLCIPVTLNSAGESRPPTPSLRHVGDRPCLTYPLCVTAGSKVTIPSVEDWLLQMPLNNYPELHILSPDCIPKLFTSTFLVV